MSSHYVVLDAATPEDPEFKAWLQANGITADAEEPNESGPNYVSTRYTGTWSRLSLMILTWFRTDVTHEDRRMVSEVRLAR